MTNRIKIQLRLIAVLGAVIVGLVVYGAIRLADRQLTVSDRKDAEISTLHSQIQDVVVKLAQIDAKLEEANGEIRRLGGNPVVTSSGPAGSPTTTVPTTRPEAPTTTTTRGPGPPAMVCQLPVVALVCDL